jgi:hypothetical protein
MENKISKTDVSIDTDVYSDIFTTLKEIGIVEAALIYILFELYGLTDSETNMLQNIYIKDVDISTYKFLCNHLYSCNWWFMNGKFTDISIKIDKSTNTLSIALPMINEYPIVELQNDKCPICNENVIGDGDDRDDTSDCTCNSKPYISSKYIVYNSTFTGDINMKEIKETVMKIIRSLYNISVAHLSFQHKCCINYLLIEYCFVYTM